MSGGRKYSDLSGVLIVDKPSGPTSFGVVKMIRAATRVKKVGHTGTLDPMASGVLTVCLGQATKLTPFLMEGRKEYIGRMLLGRATDTDDVTGRILDEQPWDRIDRQALEAAAARFTGRIEQTPPDYSAVKIDGRPAHRMARRGEKVEVKPRPVTIYRLEITDFDPPLAGFRVEASKGTYVRSLVRDIGRTLGVGACLDSLRRTANRPFTVDEALTLDQALELARTDRIRDWVIPMEKALTFMPELRISQEMTDWVKTGRSLPVTDLKPFSPEPGPVQVLAPNGGLMAVYEFIPAGEAREAPTLAPIRVLVGK